MIITATVGWSCKRNAFSWNLEMKIGKSSVKLSGEDNQALDHHGGATTNNWHSAGFQFNQTTMTTSIDNKEQQQQTTVKKRQLWTSVVTTNISLFKHPTAIPAAIRRHQIHEQHTFFWMNISLKCTALHHLQRVKNLKTQERGPWWWRRSAF